MSQADRNAEDSLGLVASEPSGTWSVILPSLKQKEKKTNKQKLITNLDIPKEYSI